MTSITKADINNQLKLITDPHVETDLVSAKSVKSIEINEDRISINLVLGYPAKGYCDQLKAVVQEKIAALNSVNEVNVDVSVEIVAHSVQQSLQPLQNIKNIIAVASGKGGVGKSTTAVNLALALQAEGAKVGILDADIYGPSIPAMMGISGPPSSEDGKTMTPKVSFGLQTISIGYLIDTDQPMIWRGPMVTSALQQLLKDTNWTDLDYLIVDLPPGTGDIQLTLSQQIPVSGAIIVTTPQDIALLDAQRGLKMFEKVNVPVLGIVENMSIHVCSNCGHEEAIFGEGGGLEMAQKNNVELLGSLPLDINIRIYADGGKPSVVADPDGRPAEIYREIARKTAAKLSLQGKDYKSKFPNIVVQNT